MEKWPDIFSDLLDHTRDAMKDDSFGNTVVAEVKVENPQPHLYPDPPLPESEVKA